MPEMVRGASPAAASSVTDCAVNLIIGGFSNRAFNGDVVHDVNAF